MSEVSVRHISLVDVLKTYFAYADDDFDKQGKGGYHTRCPIHKEKNGMSFVIYEKPTGWDWVCFGACKKLGGTAPKLLVEAGLFDTIEAAEADLKEKYNIVLPDTVNVATMSNLLAIPEAFLLDRGLQDTPDGVLFPYRGTDGQTIAVKIRLKYSGKGKYRFITGRNELFGLDLLPTYTDDIIFLTEGETDTLSMQYAGLPVLGIPGSNGWSKEWAGLLERFKQVVAVPDKDEAGDNLLQTLAESFPDRLYTMRLPGKFNDISSFLVHGCGGNATSLQLYFTTNTYSPATPTSFLSTSSHNPTIITDRESWRLLLLHIKDETGRMMFLNDLAKASKQGKRIIQSAFREATRGRRNTSPSDTSASFYASGGSYFKRVFTKDGGEQAVKLSNFTITLLYTLESDGIFTRVVQLVHEGGRASVPLHLDGATLTRPLDFIAACKDVGPYLFTGDAEDVSNLCAYLFGQGEDVVHAPRCVGHIDGHWLFGNHGVARSGARVVADDSGIITADSDRYLMRNLNTIDADDQAMLPKLPEVPEMSQEARRRVAYTLLHNLTSASPTPDYSPWMCLGWVAAGWYSDTVFRDGKDYPILFLNGKRSSGKTYLARWLMSFYGFPDSEGKNYTLPSIVAISRRLGYYASLPVWYDDYRNGGNARDANLRKSILLGAFNRQGGDRGVKQNFGLRVDPVRAFIMLSGEHTTDDNAVQTRSVILHISAYSRDDSLLEEVKSLVPSFPAIGLGMCMRSQLPGAHDRMLATVKELEQWLVSRGGDSRIARNYATLAAGFVHEFSDCVDKVDMDRFKDWVLVACGGATERKESDHTLSQFLDDLSGMVSKGLVKLDTNFSIGEDEMLYLHLPSVYQEWWEYRGRKDDLLGQPTLKDYIIKEPWCMEVDRVKKMKNLGVAKRCLRVDLYRLRMYHDELVDQLEVMVEKEEF